MELEGYRTVEAITYDHVREDRLVRQQLAKIVVSQNAVWALIVFAFRDWQRGRWKNPQIAISRWRFVAGIWRRSSSINLREAALDDTLEAVSVVRAQMNLYCDALPSSVSDT